MTEETHDAARSRPARHRHVDRRLGGRRLDPADRAHLRDPELRQRASTRPTGVPPAQIFIDAVGDTGGKLLLLIVIGAQLFCGMASVTANSRMIYAFSRDGALPASRVWHRINPRTRTPTHAIWLAAGGAFVLGLPYLWNATAYAAVTSIAVIGLYIAYVLPTFLRLRQGDAFEPGPWHLGRWSRPIGIDRRGLGRLHHDPVHAADGQPDQRRELQLHADRGARRPRVRRHLVAGLGEELVHRAEGAGHARRSWPRPSGSWRALPDRRAASSPSRTCAVSWSTTARSTPSSSRSPTCRAGCRASGCTPGTSWTSSWSTRTEGCNYLLAVDVDMNTVDGYAMSSWSSGYGDFVMQPDLSTLRPVPWNPGTAMVLADLRWEDGSPVVASPRQVLARQTARLADAGMARLRRHRAGVHRLPRHLRAGLDRRLPRPHPGQPVQRRLLACSAPPGSSRCCAGSATT